MHFLLIIVITEAADESMFCSVQNNNSKGYGRNLDYHKGEKLKLSFENYGIMTNQRVFVGSTSRPKSGVLPVLTNEI